MELWHGGRDLEYNYRAPKPCAKGRWEGGPGLYLTTHYETAYKYSKGGGKTYKVDFELGNNQADVYIPLDKVIDFVSKSVAVKHRKNIISDIHDNAKRLGNFESVKSEVLVNLCINYEALTPKKTVELNRFLVENNVDYGTITNYSGRPETVIVLYNLDLIQKVKAIPSKDVSLEEYILPINLNKNSLKATI